MGTLYIVGTPIGNLGDLSPRGKATLGEVDFIAAEDTRLSRGLLTHFGISTPMISYHQHNCRETGEEIANRLANGEHCALITDAGMPAISDPGEDLVRLCHQRHIPVVAVPGPTAFATALAISGFPSRRFTFEGFLEGKESQRRDQLLDVRDLTRTLIYYEAPHKLLSTLILMESIFGNREIALCREITKIYEEVLLFTLEEAIAYYNDTAPRGEFVVIVKGAIPEELEEISFEQAVAMVLSRKEQGVPLSKAAKEVAEITGHRKSDLYKETLV